jgi:hypothetical protein
MVKDSKKARRFVGLDVHAASIAVAAAEKDGEVRSLGTNHDYAGGLSCPIREYQSDQPSLLASSALTRVVTR